MLTLTRSVGERIMIGDDIVIEVRAIIDGRQVRIAIDAPRQVPVHRAELVDAISKENQKAAMADPGSDSALGALGQAVVTKPAEHRPVTKPTQDQPAQDQPAQDPV